MNLAKLLETRGRTILGPLTKDTVTMVMEYVTNPAPTDEDWDRIHSRVINNSSKARTVWQAVVAIDPTFPREILANPKGRKWPRVPDPLTVARAVRSALS